MSKDAMNLALEEMKIGNYNSAAERLEVALAEQPAQQEHITDGSRCWCNPDLDYKDPDTGAEVWIHKEPN